MSIQHTDLPQSEKNRLELEQLAVRLYEEQGWEIRGFYIPPNVIMSHEAATAEVLAGLKSFERDGLAGRAVHSSATTRL